MAAAEMVTLVSSVAGKHLVLRPTQEVHDISGRRLVTEKSQVVKFSRGRAQVPSEWVGLVQQCKSYGKDVWIEGENGAPMPTGGVQVVSGSLGAAYRQEVRPPHEGWDQMGARELRELILRGGVADPVRAMTYEVTHRNRSQVVAAISQAIRGEADPEPVEPEAAQPAEGFVQALPPGTEV